VHENDRVSSWKRFDTVDYWRHERMYKTILPILQSYPANAWLTVGDGRFGTDANFLLRHGANPLATDINDTLLRQANAEGFITKYQCENAEKLSFEDNAFDFVLCKESYHHFPRPMLALYEMLRVCRKAVILIEPKDHELINPFRQNFHSAIFWLIQSIKNQVKSIMGMPRYSPEPSYEPVGNYIYSISQRELEKLALGMNLPALATKDLNDFYFDGVEHELISSNGPLFNVLQKKLHAADIISKKREEEAGLLIATIFKVDPSEGCKISLRQAGFHLQQLHRNPYSNSE
jgi:ubiquinone/menaquinone biosynthesis C-methylase UbiE